MIGVFDEKFGYSDELHEGEIIEFENNDPWRFMVVTGGFGMSKASTVYAKIYGNFGKTKEDAIKNYREEKESDGTIRMSCRVVGQVSAEDVKARKQHAQDNEQAEKKIKAGISRLFGKTVHLRTVIWVESGKTEYYIQLKGALTPAQAQALNRQGLYVTRVQDGAEGKKVYLDILR